MTDAYDQLSKYLDGESDKDSDPPKLGNGTLVGRYEILDHMGSGGMSHVYKVRDTQTAATLALKIMFSTIHFNTIEWEAEVGRILGPHQNIVSVHGCDEHDGQKYLLMDFVQGENLQDAIKQQLSLPRALQITQEIALALDYVHNHDLVHGDVKPKNVLLAERARLFDFGTAYHTKLQRPQYEKGKLIGTPSYMSPERMHGSEPDACSDIYSLGATLYEMLTCQTPFDADHTADTIAQVLSKDLAPPRTIKPDIPPEIEAICMKAMAKDPKNRYQRAPEVIEAITALRIAA